MFESIGEFFKGIFTELINFLTELPILVLQGILGAIATVIEAIPAPDIITTSITDYIHEDIAWFLVMSNFPAGLAIIGTGITFYFLRRILTLGIW